MQGTGRSANQQRDNVRRPERRRGERAGLTADWLGCTRYNGLLQGLLESGSERPESPEATATASVQYEEIKGS